MGEPALSVCLPSGWEWHPASDVGDTIGSGTLRPKALCCKGYGVNDVDDVFS